MKSLPQSLYVHIPWCVRKCPYCDFNSHQPNTPIPEADYVQALAHNLAQVTQFLPKPSDTRLHSIFFGGGTPSIFSPGAIAQILKDAEQQCGFQDDIEITLEANPGTVDSDKFEGLLAAGVNRLSLGIQSFQPRFLRSLGRIHNADEANTAVQRAREAGFKNINLDLMFGLPDQSLEEAMADLQTAIALQPQHISWYQLTIEPNTEFYRRPPQLPEDELIWEIHQRGAALLERSGYPQYEVSAYARPENRSRHNLNYWTFGDYLAIGAGSHGKVSNLQSRTIRRYANTRIPKHYLARQHGYLATEETISAEELPFEFMMNVLRLKDGVEETLFLERTGLPLDVCQPALSRLRDLGLLEPHRLQCTTLGYRHLNSVLEMFLNDASIPALPG